MALIPIFLTTLFVYSLWFTTYRTQCTGGLDSVHGRRQKSW